MFFFVPFASTLFGASRVSKTELYLVNVCVCVCVVTDRLHMCVSTCVRVCVHAAIVAI